MGGGAVHGRGMRSDNQPARTVQSCAEQQHATGAGLPAADSPLPLTPLRLKLLGELQLHALPGQSLHRSLAASRQADKQTGGARRGGTQFTLRAGAGRRCIRPAGNQPAALLVPTAAILAGQ